MKLLPTMLFLALATGAMAINSHPALSQQKGPRIGYLAFGRATPPALFVRKMNEAGFFDGQSATFEFRFADGRHELLLPLARELVAHKVDLIFAVGDEAVSAAQSATKTIPIVIFACDAVTAGFVASLAKPGNNTTGVTCITAELSRKRVSLFKEMLPNIKHLAILYNPLNPSKPNDFAQTRDAAASPGISTKGFEAQEPADIEQAFSEFGRDPPDGVSVLDESFTLLNAKLIAELLGKRNLPSMHSFREPVNPAELMSYGPLQTELY